MLVFRQGQWQEVEVPFSDPMFTTGHLLEAAASITSLRKKGHSLQSAQAETEKILYMRIYPGLTVSREEHGTPKN